LGGWVMTEAVFIGLPLDRPPGWFEVQAHDTNRRVALDLLTVGGGPG
jgi:hypothetical protein